MLSAAARYRVFADQADRRGGPGAEGGQAAGETGRDRGVPVGAQLQVAGQAHGPADDEGSGDVDRERRPRPVRIGSPGGAQTRSRRRTAGGLPPPRRPRPAARSSLGTAAEVGDRLAGFPAGGRGARGPGRARARGRPASVAWKPPRICWSMAITSAEKVVKEPSRPGPMPARSQKAVLWPRDPEGGQGGQDETPGDVDRQRGPRHRAGAFGEHQAGAEPQLGSDQPADGDGGPGLPARHAGARHGPALVQRTLHSALRRRCSRRARHRCGPRGPRRLPRRNRIRAVPRRNRSAPPGGRRRACRPTTSTSASRSMSSAAR